MNINIDVNLDEYNALYDKLMQYKNKYSEIATERGKLLLQIERLNGEKKVLENDDNCIQEEKEKKINEKLISKSNLIKVTISILLIEWVASILMAVNGVDMQYIYPIPAVMFVSVFACPLAAVVINLKKEMKIINSEDYKKLDEKTLDIIKKIGGIDYEIDKLEMGVQYFDEELSDLSNLIDDMREKIDVYKDNLFNDVLINAGDNERVVDKAACKKRTLVNVSQFKK